MYNPDNYLAQVVGTFLVCQQIAFSSFVANWESVFIFSTPLLIQTPNLKSAHGPHPVGRFTYIRHHASGWKGDADQISDHPPFNFSQGEGLDTPHSACLGIVVHICLRLQPTKWWIHFNWLYALIYSAMAYPLRFLIKTKKMKNKSMKSKYAYIDYCLFSCLLATIVSRTCLFHVFKKPSVS